MMRRPRQDDEEAKNEREAKREARDEFISRHLRAAIDESRMIRQRNGDAFLAMFAKPSNAMCEPCFNDYTERGITEHNRYLLHEHYTLADLEGNPALELAIVEAKRACPHPLESAATRRTPEQNRAMIATIRETIGAKP